ncbi:putative iron-regulated membrane protein [Mucilaginibacter gracilis]|uniref:Putative iron-regulated membrane protein n=1 Tax=Mucilaginibacter gracilis TaxID=423350 RepID=A0A495J1J6_9SPHI|nr:PepSY-associated TM helix domain-containing protein [Mucilaginibacter gracilis]RKR81959.1 putative iron-regulated membrane protein [Mucilaginibacter gracilis]
MIKKIAGKLHLWLGLASGLVVFISLFGAAVFVWQTELTNWLHRDMVYVPAIGRQELPMDILIRSAKLVEPGRDITYVARARDPHKSVVFDVVKLNPHPSWYYQSAYLVYEQVYVDRYTGKVLGIIDNRRELIWIMYALHTSLQLKYEVGHYIVGTATLILFVMALTGIVLWWPKHKAALKQRLWFRWKKTTRWRRKNYDLHNIGGIYTWIFILFFAATGLAWTFSWWESGIYRLLGADPKKMFAEPSVKPAIKSAYTYESLIQNAEKRVPHWESIGFSLPGQAKPDSAQALFCVVHYNTGSGWDEWDEYLYNSQNGRLYYSQTQAQKQLGEKWRTSNYALHTGSIYGLPTKILATFIALFCAFLPISGFLIWLGRRKKTTRMSGK